MVILGETPPFEAASLVQGSLNKGFIETRISQYNETYHNDRDGIKYTVTWCCKLGDILYALTVLTAFSLIVLSVILSAPSCG